MPLAILRYSRRWHVKNNNTDEIMTPESIGLKNQALNLTSRSGRAAVKSHMDTMGYSDSDYNSKYFCMKTF